MTFRKLVTLVILACLVLFLALAIILLSNNNERTQQRLQVQQVALNSGVLGPQGQQISSAILQDMANASTNNSALRNLLGKYGFTVQNGSAASSTTNVAQTVTTNDDEARNE